MSADFRIPVAIERSARATRRLVSPEEARKDVAYVCPICNITVDLHAGEKKRRHFHHRRGLSSSCSAESVLHVTAKLLIVQAIHDWVTASRAALSAEGISAKPATAPQFDRKCANAECTMRCRQSLPKKVVRAAVEHRLPSGFVVDVALFAAGIDLLPISAIEIRHTHAVDELKAGEIGIPWIEAEAEQVCADQGRIIVAVRDRFLPWHCELHSPASASPASPTSPLARKAIKEREHRVSAAIELARFPAYSIARITKCPRCTADAAILTWRGKHPPDPRPRTVRAFENDRDVVHDSITKNKSKVLPFRRQWSNVCPSCGERLAD